jgi:inward rectifier potassium channel
VLETVAPYQQLLTMSWTAFLGAVALAYLGFNALFAAAYVLCGPDALIGADAHALGGALGRAFFFSVQTFATIGYGQINPNGLAPNGIVTLEALVGLMFQALATGLLFARFSRPTASILFSRRALIAPYGDGQSLQFRIANRRKNQIIQLEAQVLFSLLETDQRGDRVRRYYPLPLERNKVTFFPLSWTIVHPIGDTSPLAGRTAEDLARSEAEILVLLSGIPMKTAIGTSLAIVAANASTGFVGYMGVVPVDWTTMISFTSVTVAGSFVDTRIAHRFSQEGLKRSFGVFLIFVASYILLKSVL